MMECNKDEAMRGKDIAEKKMQNNDFEGARRMAMKARKLYPELENMNKLLTVCDVHCAAQNKIHGSENDFYGILQLAKFADEVTIKKQYRKLALTLHPDKNKLPGAEAAFKLVCEANVFLLDPGKKAAYDRKCKVLVTTEQAKPSSYQFCSLNRRQTTSIPSVIQETLYTVCPYCKFKFSCLTRLANHVVPCQRCTKTFPAYDISAQNIPGASNKQKPMPPGNVCSTQPHSQGVSSTQPLSQDVPSAASGASRYQTPVFPSKAAPHAGSSRMGVPNANAAGIGIRTQLHGHAAEGLKDKCDNKDGTNGGVDAHKNKRESGVGKNCKKRSRKHAAESSESCDTSSRSDDLDKDHATDSGVDGARITRRSSRQRQNVSYKENESDNDDFESLFKRSSKSKSSGDTVVKEATVSKNDTTWPVNIKANVKSEGNGYSKNGQMEKIQKAGGYVPVVEILDDFESDQTVYDLPDAEFTDFDKEKEEDCFAVDQIWALYDKLDGMPRFYALIKKVFKRGFKLKINWLEGDPEDDGEISWLDEELPFGCGRFQFGDSDINSDRLSFSHQVHYKKNNKSIFIHPQKGEIWALLQDWNINWNSDPEKHKKYKYEIVEVVSDFSVEAGVRVCYLDKVRGFAWLFKRASIREADFLLIHSDEMLRFSHRIPCAKMSGTEREGVPVGSFELDPASLPQDPNDISYPLKVTSDNGNNR